MRSSLCCSWDAKEHQLPMDCLNTNISGIDCFMFLWSVNGTYSEKRASSLSYDWKSLQPLLSNFFSFKMWYSHNSFLSSTDSVQNFSAVLCILHGTVDMGFFYKTLVTFFWRCTDCTVVVYEHCLLKWLPPQ